ncbi:hypothetical protein MMC12_001671 [Toensbergia leucococca]|nr:hypothetical protein [Toensbergia leucococca]
MSLRIAPAPPHPSSATNLTTISTSTRSPPGAPSAPGIHDTLRANLTPIINPSSSAPQPLLSAHPLEARLARWQATQDDLKMTGLRRTFGIAEPVRRGMELRIAREGEWRPAVLGASAGISGDVLAGRDAEVAWEDVFKGDETREGVDFHTEMEGRLRMKW